MDLWRDLYKEIYKNWFESTVRKFGNGFALWLPLQLWNGTPLSLKQIAL